MEGNYWEHMPRPSFVYCTMSYAKQNGQENFKSPSVDHSRPSSVHTCSNCLMSCEIYTPSEGPDGMLLERNGKLTMWKSKSSHLPYSLVESLPQLFVRVAINLENMENLGNSGN